MAEYINRTELIEDLNKFAPEYYNALINQLITKQPTADVQEVKHGYFVRNERNIPKMKEFHERGYALSMSEKSIFYTCSACGEWISLSQKYCSECGAKMDGTPKERGGEK